MLMGVCGCAEGPLQILHGLCLCPSVDNPTTEGRATSKLPRGELDHALASQFIFSSGERVGSLLAMVRGGEGEVPKNDSSARDWRSID